MNISVYLDGFESLSLREQMLVVLTFVVVLVFLTQVLLFDTLALGVTQAQQKLDNARRVSVSLQAKVAQQPGAEARMVQLNNEVAAAELALDEVDQQLEALAGSLISAQQMIMLLKTLLDNSELQLVALENLPPETLVAAKNGPNGPQGLYKHGLKIKLQGTYGAAMAYLQDLEGQPWRFIWQSMAYEVLAHPTAVMSLEIQTLSLEPQWLGY